MKRNTLYQLLALVFVTVLLFALAPAPPSLATTFESPPTEEYPPLPPIDGPADLGSWVVGAPALVLVIVEILKRMGWIPDGTAGRWAAIGNFALYALFVILGLFKIDVTGANVASLIEILTEIGRLVQLVLGSPLLYTLGRWSGIITPLPDRHGPAV